MNVCLRNTFVSLWLFFGALSLSAQGASFFFPFLNNAAPGSNKLLPLRVVNFDSAVALQLVVRWDPSVLKYINIDQMNLPGLVGSDFNTSHAIDSGYIRLQWEGDTSLPPGISVADSSIIFRLRFNVIGQCDTGSAVRVTELLTFPPTNFELVKVLPDTSNVGYDLEDCPHTDGFVAVCYTVDAQEPRATEIPVSLSPNPFGESSHLQFELTETADVQVLVADAMGRIVLEKNLFKAAPGQHGMVIEKSMLAAPGVYSLRLQAGRKTATRTLVLL